MTWHLMLLLLLLVPPAKPPPAPAQQVPHGFGIMCVSMYVQWRLLLASKDMFGNAGRH